LHVCSTYPIAADGLRPGKIIYFNVEGKTMITKRLLVAVATASAIALGAVGCAETGTRESTGQYIDSAAITTKVKTAIARDDRLSVFDIKVDTYKDVVQLSGFVDTAAQKAHATTVASRVDGVQAVRNDLVVK
jgi:osmotically-inducible protein OsmY